MRRPDRARRCRRNHSWLRRRDEPRRTLDPDVEEPTEQAPAGGDRTVGTHPPTSLADRLKRHLKTDASLLASLVVIEDTLVELVANALRQAGASEAVTYAVTKTGLFPVAGREHLLTDEELDDWNAALEEFEAKIN